MGYSDPMTTAPILGRRDRNKAAKRAAISRAATQLFTEQGYAATTTQQVARAADIAEGTLFRYASSKPELLLMVINEHLRPLVDGVEEPSGVAVEDEILQLLSPIIDLAESQPENAAPFLREVLFGEDGPQRREALGLVDRVVSRIAVLLHPYEDRLEGMELAEAARWVFSALVSELLQDVVGRGTTDRQAALRARVRVLLRGLGAA